jgi:methylmalonyl-CoA mutase cobalamin-binding subunit
MTAEGRHIELVVGGVIPPGDIPALKRRARRGVSAWHKINRCGDRDFLILLARRRNIS